MLELPRKAGRGQDDQLWPVVGPHSIKRAQPRTFEIPVQHTEAKAVNLYNQRERKKTNHFQLTSHFQLQPVTILLHSTDFKACSSYEQMGAMQ